MRRGPIVIILLLSATACSNRNLSPPGTLTTVLPAPVASLNPLYATDANSQHVNELLHAGLMTIGRDLSPEPYLAESVRVVKPTLLEFRLRTNCRFSSGARITSADVARSLAYFQDPANQSSFGETFRVIKKFEAVDDLTFRLELSKPTPALLTDLELLKILDLSEEKKFHGRPSHLIGAGPFRLVAFTPGQLDLERVNQPCLPQPHSKSIRIKVVRDDLSRFLKLKMGEVDVVLNDLNYRKAHDIVNDPKSPLLVASVDGVGYSYLGLNLQSAHLRDLRVRRALALSLDLPSLIKYKSRGFADQARNLLADRNFFANLSVPRVQRDLEAARKLLADAGYGPNRPLELTLKTTNNSIAVENARVLVAQAAEAGIRLRLQSLEWGVFYQDVKSGNTEVYQLRWVGVTDPRIYFENFHSKEIGRNNRTRYESPEMDSLTEVGEREMDRTKRKEAYARVQELAARDLPYVGLWYGKNVIVHRRNITEVEPLPNGSWKALLKMRKQ